MTRGAFNDVSEAPMRTYRLAGQPALGAGAGGSSCDSRCVPELATIALRDGRAIPQLGFGVFQIPPGGATQAAVEAALAAGCRHVDTAAVHRNESDVGAAIRASGLGPGTVWVTTKLANADQGTDPGPLRRPSSEPRRLRPADRGRRRPRRSDARRAHHPLHPRARL